MSPFKQLLLDAVERRNSTLRHLYRTSVTSRTLTLTYDTEDSALSFNPPKCRCRPPLLCTLDNSTREGPNFGRPFHKCCRKTNRCQHFSWAFTSYMMQWYRFGPHNGHALVNSDGFRAEDLVQGKLTSIGSFDELPTGIYWGYARIITGNGSSDDSGEEKSGNDSNISGKEVYTAAISIGYNPTYNNKEKTVEPHLIAESNHPLRHASFTGEAQFGDFYESTIVLSVVGFLRPELPFEGLEKLTLAIKKDIEDACRLSKEKTATNQREREWVMLHKQS